MERRGAPRRLPPVPSRRWCDVTYAGRPITLYGAAGRGQPGGLRLEVRAPGARSAARRPPPLPPSASQSPHARRATRRPRVSEIPAAGERRLRGGEQR